MAYFEDLDRENLICVNFDNGMHAINFHVVATGDHTGAQTNISNIFKTAILSNATGFILFHNHPSGQIKPSKQDIHLTQAVAKAADFMGIQLIDHIICAPQGNFFSFKEENLL